MRELILVIHDVRSCHNVGAMLRTAEGLGTSEVILTGYTPFPKMANDPRLPHLADKIDKQIAKTSLGAQISLAWRHGPDVKVALKELKTRGFCVAALEQARNSVQLPDFKPPDRLALVVGNEVTGLAASMLALVDMTLEIPMLGKKESLNVASAAAIALAHCRFYK